jgi:hypothetical protein
MFMPTVGFLRSLSIDRKCPACDGHYLGAMETENVGICGRCLSMAFPVQMREEKVTKPAGKSRRRVLLSLLNL